MIVVIDYCVGNVKSVCNALDKIGCPNSLTAEPEHIKNASGIILPGVAAFGFAMNALGESSAANIKEAALGGKPLLGICSGYQILFDSSTELGEHKGLGLISGTVDKLSDDVVIPHMGWNLVEPADGMRLFDGIGPEHFYFAHSFHANITDPAAKAATVEYGGHNVIASVEKGNIFGVQFHPEKSSAKGMEVLKNFEKICRR
ncbi:MAG: imidazole glycerol phosphate synthase subunit HisH [Phycisphaerae bacterium]